MQEIAYLKKRKKEADIVSAYKQNVLGSKKMNKTILIKVLKPNKIKLIEEHEIYFGVQLINRIL